MREIGILAVSRFLSETMGGFSKRRKSPDRRGDAGWSVDFTDLTGLLRPWAGAGIGVLDAGKGNPRRPDGPVALFEGDP